MKKKRCRNCIRSAECSIAVGHITANKTCQKCRGQSNWEPKKHKHEWENVGRIEYSTWTKRRDWCSICGTLRTSHYKKPYKYRRPKNAVH